MRPHQFGNRRNVITLSLLASLILGAIFVFAPMSSIAAARQALATRVSASPTAQRIMSITPAPVRALVRRQFEPVTTRGAVEPISVAAAPSLSSSLTGPTAAMAVTSFTQTVTPETVCAGSLLPGGGSQSVGYVLTVTNDGAADSGIQLSITLPAGFNIVQVNVSGFSGFACNGPGSNGQLCTGGSLAASTVGTLGLSVFIPGTTPAGVYSPISQGSYQSTQTTTLGAAGNADVTVQRCLTVGIAKNRSINNPSGDDAVAGQSDILYDIAVQNFGPSTALPGELTLTDLLIPQAGITLTPGPATGGTFSGACTTANLFTVGCSNTSNIPVGGLTNLTFFVSVPANAALTPAECTTINNQATVTAPGASQTNAPQVANAPVVTVVQRGNFAINNFQSNPAQIFAGDNIVYSFNLDRVGPNPSIIYGGQVTLTLPAPPGTISQLLFSTPPAGWTCVPPNLTFNPTVITCTPPATGIPAPPPPVSLPFQFVVKTNSLLASGTSLSATAAWTPPGPGVCDTGVISDPASAVDGLVVLTRADLGILKIAGPAAVTAGDPASILTYQLIFGNNPGIEPAGDAVNVSIVDNVPANTTVVTQPVWAQTTGPVLFPAAVINITCSPVPVNGGQQFICTPTGNTGIDPSYADGVLPEGVTGTITYQVTVPAGIAQNTIIGNAASINSNTAGLVQFTPDPNSGNNVSLTTSTLVNAISDMSVTKVGLPATVNAGGLITYTITTTNNGPSVANNVVLSDVVTAPLGFASIIPGAFSCVTPVPNGTGPVNCTLASLAPGASSAITLVLRVIPSFAGPTVSNTATVSSDSAEPTPNTNPNSATQITDVTQLANLLITKFVSPNPAVAGGLFTYQIRVQNTGPSNATGVVVTDNWAAGQFQFVSATGTNAFSAPGACVDTGGPAYTVTCTPGGGILPLGAISDIFITFRLNPDASCPQPTGGLGNTANVATATPGNAAAPAGLNSNPVQLNVVRQPDLQITKTDTPDPVNAGNNITYLLTVKNNGPSTAATGEVVVTDPLPAQTTVVSVVGTGVFAGCTSAQLTGAGCANSAPMPPNAQDTITYVVKVNANFAPIPGTVTNTATVTVTVVQPCPIPPPPGFAGNGAALAAQLANGDPNLSNNTATTITTVGSGADLQLTKTATTVFGVSALSEVVAGGVFTPIIGTPGPGEILYTLSYRNDGATDAQNVHIRDPLPANATINPTPSVPTGGVVVTTASGPAFACSIVTILTVEQLDCTTAGGVPLPPGANGTIRFKVFVPANVLQGTVITNQAKIESEGPGGSVTPDPNPTNNTTVTTQNRVLAIADVGIAKTDSADPVAAGTEFDYLINVRNAGPSDAQNVVVSDTLPAQVTFVSITKPAAYSCTTPPVGSGGLVTCNRAVLPPNGPPGDLITVRVKVKSDTPAGGISNTATIATSTSQLAQLPQPLSPYLDVLPNSDSETTTITTSALLTITKSAAPNPVVAGTNLTYTITVNNTGPSDATGVVVTEPLPAETDFVSVTGTGVFSPAGACSFAPGIPTGTVTCNALPGGILAAGAAATITIVVKVESGAVGPNIGPNVATVAWTNPAASTAVSGEVTVALNRQADLQLDKTCAASTIAGQNIDCTIKIKNNGPSDVKGNQGAPGEPPTPPVPGSVVITDLLPGGANYVSVQVAGAGGFTCTFAPGVFPAGGTVTCLNAAGDSGNIPAGGEATLIIKSTTPSDAAAGSNSCDTARIEVIPSLHPDPDPVDPITSNNVDTACAVVSTSADLSVNKTSVPVVDPDGVGPLAPVALPIPGPNVPPGSVNAGGYIRYDVTFGNSGPSDAINVLLNNVVPANTAFVGAIATGGFYVPAAQPPAVPFVFTILAADSVAPLGPPISLTCTVIGAAGSQQIFCRPQGNGALVPPYGDGVLPAGYSGLLTFFVKVNESVTGGSIITDPAIITSGLCPNGLGPVPPPFPPVTCPGTPDPNTSNNTSQITENVVVASSQLGITKIVQSAVTAASSPNQTGPIGPSTAPNGAGLTGTPVIAGTVLTYRVFITNTGPSDVSNIRLTDVLPSGLETPPGRVLGVRYISVNPVLPSGATFTCAAPTGINPANNPQGNGGSLVCTAPLLSANAPNNIAAIDITVFIDPATRASLVNTATVDATINNFNQPISGTAVLTTPVVSQADLALTKTHTPDPVIAGTVFTYTVTLTNNGQSAAHNVSLVDTLPAFQKVTNIAIQTTPNGNGAPAFTCVGVPVIGSPGNTTSVTCTAPELPPNKNPDNTVNPSGTATIVLTVLQDPLTPQPVPLSYLNCVTATTTSTDPVPVNNTTICDTVNIGFVADPDTVTLRKVDVPDPVIAGNLLTYTITATNNGPSAALNFRISDQLPANVRFISAVASPGAELATPAVGATGLVTATWTAAGGTPGGLTAVGVQRILTIVVRVCPDVICNTVISNTAISSSQTPDGRVDNNTDTATTNVQSQSDLSISKSDSPDPVKPSTAEPSPIDSILTYTITFSNAGPSNSANTIITDVLPAGFTVVSLSSTVAGTIFNQSVGGPQGDQITVTANLGVLGAANQCAVTPLATSGTITIRVRVPNKFPNGLVTNTATISSGNCLPDPDPSDNTAIAVTEVSQEPQGGSAGLAFPASAEASDDKSGSVLFFPHYTSNASVPAQQNTTISITNTGIFDNAVVHLFVVDGATCSAQDVYICLTRNQTMSFLASDFDPGITGYIVAVAVNPVSGRPISFNCLVGDAYVKHTTGHKAAYGAVAVSTLLNNPAGVDPLATTAVLRFDGVHYNRLPRILAVDGLASPGEGNSAIISLMAVGGNMSQSGARIGSVTGNLFDDRENNYSFNEPAPNCTFTRTLNDSFPRTFTPYSGVVSPGHSGWMKIRAFSDIGILGIILNFNPNSGTTSNAFNNGRGLHGLTLTTASTLTIPVDIPECH